MKRLVVGQGGGPTPVINDSLAGVIDEARERKISAVGMINGFEGFLHAFEVEGNLRNLDDIDTTKLRGTPGAFLGTCRMKLNPEKDCEKINKINGNVKSLGADGVLYIGGNDSALILDAIKNGIHVEKTIDNDLPENDHTSGWGSASLCNSEIIRALDLDMGGFAPKVINGKREVYSAAPVVVYQAQGRDTGWLTLGTAFAKLNENEEVERRHAPHLFLPREAIFDESLFLNKVDDLLSSQGYVFIVCGEELIDNRLGILLSQVAKAKETTDGFEHTEHARTGAFNHAEYITSLIKNELKVDGKTYAKIKDTPFTPQHIQRTLMRSKVDADEAYEAGREAVRAFDSEEFGVSICLKRVDNYKIIPYRVPLEKVAGKVRRVDEKYLGTIEGPSEQFYKDFLPLLGGVNAFSHYLRR